MYMLVQAPALSLKPETAPKQRLGLIIQNCWVSSISNPVAAQWGWQACDWG